MGEMAATGPEEVERLKQEIIRLTQVLVILMKIIVTELMILMVKMIFIIVMVTSNWLLMQLMVKMRKTFEPGNTEGARPYKHRQNLVCSVWTSPA